MISFRKSVFFIGCIFFQAGFSQPIPLSIKDMLQQVEKSLPQLEVSRQQAAAAKEEISLSRSSLVPELNAGYQLNIATYNNITGMSYPGFMLPISGPPSANNNLNFVPGSAAGALLKWNPFTFGQRNAAIEKAMASFKQTNASYNEQLFRYQYRALDTYIEAVYIQQVIKTLKAAVERNKAGLEQSLVLAVTGLKQGIDTTQFQASIAQGEIDVLQAEKTYLLNINNLAALTGIKTAAENIILTDTVFQPAAVPFADSSGIKRNPYYENLHAQQQVTEARLNEIKKSWMPKMDIWGNAYSRGSGIHADGTVDKPDGFGFSRTNLGAGLQLSFPVLQYTKVAIQKKQYQFLLRAGEAKLQQSELDITTQTASALEQYQKDIAIAAKAPVLLKAATDVFEGLKLSYENGLIDYTRLAQAQYDLVKAEMNEAGSQLQLQRSLLAIAIAKGDLDIFLVQLK